VAEGFVTKSVEYILIQIMSINKTLLKQIKSMVEIDQKARKEAMARIKVGSSYKTEGRCIGAIDHIHNFKLKKIISKHGYPNKKLLGKVGIRKVWLLIQHQDQDIKLQKNCLNKCEFENKEKAYLIDRIMTKEEGKQLYGTQFRGNPKTSKMRPFPIKDRKNLDKRRKHMGLETFAEYKKRMPKRK